MSRFLARRGHDVVAILLVATVLGSALGIGAVHVPVLAVISVLAFVGAFLALRGNLVPHSGLPAPAWGALLLGIYSVLQALPMPLGWLARIAPENADVWREALRSLGESNARWVSLSLDSGASWFEGLKWCIYAATFVMASAVGARRGNAAGVGLVFLSAVIVGAVTMAHGLAGAERVFGFYRPSFSATSWHVGPLLNPNNLAGYLVLGMLCGLGLLVSREPPVARWLIGLGIAMGMAAVVLSASRSGVAALLLGVVALAFALRWTRSKFGRRSLASAATVRLVFGTAIIGGVVLSVLGASRQTLDELFDKDLQKLSALSWTKQMILDHPLFGIGRGAFESVFPAYRIGPDNMVYAHAENFIAQWTSEWGVPVAVAAMLYFAWALRPRVLGVGRSVISTAALLGAGALLVQNLLDLGLEIPAIPIAVCAALGACWGEARVWQRGREARDSESGTRGSMARRLGWAFSALGAAVCILGTFKGWHTVGHDRNDIRASYRRLKVSDAVALAQFRANLRDATLRHPAEPYFPRLEATVAWQARDRNPLPWIDRALERAMWSGRTHYLLARILAERGAVHQTLLELRLASEYEGALLDRVAQLALQLTTKYEDLVQAAPEGKMGSQLLYRMVRALKGSEHARDRERCLMTAIERNPDFWPARLDLANGTLQAIEHPEETDECSAEHKAECEQRVENQVRELRARRPKYPESAELHAKLLLATGKPAEAEAYLREHCAEFRPNSTCLKLRVTAAAKTDSHELLETAAAALASSCDVDCVQTYGWLGDSMASHEQWQLAMNYYERAANDSGGSDDLWLKLADVASKAGAHARAAELFARLTIRRRDPRLLTRLAEERSQALRGTVQE